MNNIKKRAHAYAVEHQYNINPVSLMRAYIAGANDERKRTKVFLSGKVSGMEYYVAYAKFCNADRLLSQMGYQVVNPMKICKKNWCWLRCMIKCLWAIIFCRKFHQLDNWRDSRGARIEYKWAKFLKKEFV